MEYIDYSAGQAASQDAAEDITTNSAQSVPHYNHMSSSYAPDQSKPPYLHQAFPAPISCDIKPRLTKEQHDILEAHFQKQNKPNTNIKKGFAETLNVSLDKVNNWFQNRRAKLKQDAKKQHGTLNLYHGIPPASSSDSETSPGFVDTSSQYHAMMQRWSSEQHLPNALGISQMQQAPAHVSPPGLQFHHHAPQSATAHFNAYSDSTHLNPDMFSSQEELNRRTLTQEQFDAMERDGGMMNDFGNFEDFDTSFSGDHMVMNTVFPGYADDFKQSDLYTYPIGAPMTSYDSTVPSNLSMESLPAFPSTTQMQPQANPSSTSSDWSDSRSSSIHESSIPQMSLQQQHQSAATSQWQPGSSIPVDSNQQREEFEQIAAQARSSPQQHSMHEQPLSWPDDAYVRRSSTASQLVNPMSSFGIQTPPQGAAATFKSPAPPSNIAARRQRAPRPAALGVAALRSQSHSGAVLPASPSHVQQQQSNLADQHLRRIKSSNFLGNVAPGRVMKSTPGSAQRSPLHYTFADAMNSPRASRNFSGPSNGSLAPPTPLSPKEPTAADHTGQFQVWQSNPAPMNHQASIAETEAEHGLAYHPSGVLPGQNWSSSPPHTPMYHQHHINHPRFNGNSIMENTPPQSAPASQTCFPSNAFAMPSRPQPHVAPPPPPQPVQSQSAIQQPMHIIQAQPQPQAQRFVRSTPSEQQLQPPNVTFAPIQQVNMATSGPPAGMPLTFAQGVPILNSHGEVVLGFPPEMQFVQQPQSQGHTPPHQMNSSPQMTYPFATSASGSPSSMASAHPSKSTSDFFVHEYTPSEAMKRAATPRKGGGDTGPKNYSFSHTGPEHFEAKSAAEEKKLKSDTHSSPASSNGSAFIS